MYKRQVLIVGVFKINNLYSTDREFTISREFLLVLNCILYPSVIIASAIFLFQFKFFSRFVFGLNFIGLVFFLGGWRIIKRVILRRLIAKGYGSFNVLIVGAGRIGKLLYQALKDRAFLGLKPVGFIDDFKTSSNDLPIPILGKVIDVEKICKKYFIDEIFITIPSERKVFSEILKVAKRLHVGIRVIPDSFQDTDILVRSSNIGPLPVLTYKEKKLPPSGIVLKQTFDFLFALIGIIFLSPLFLIIGILVKLESSGRVFFKQARMGEKGKIFYVYKFRSMREDADKIKSLLIDRNEVKGGGIFKIKNDPRVTKVGRFIRKYSLDELPQIFNVLFGEMSFVGPRPFPVEESKKLDYNHMPRLNIKPGITGLPQIRGRSDLSFYKWMRWDLWYINNWSFWLDLWILWKTIPAVIKGKGAY